MNYIAKGLFNCELRVVYWKDIFSKKDLYVCYISKEWKGNLFQTNFCNFFVLLIEKYIIARVVKVI